MDTQTKRNLEILRPHPGDILDISNGWNAVFGTRLKIEATPEFMEVVSYFRFEELLENLPIQRMSNEDIHSIAIEFYSRACKILNDCLIAELANDELSLEEWLSMPDDLYYAIQTHVRRREARKAMFSAMTKAVTVDVATPA